MRVEIKDDFDLKIIAESGQCFRVKEIKDGLYRFVTKKKYLYMKKLSPAPFHDSRKKSASSSVLFDVSCDENEWTCFWLPYFDAGFSYADFRKNVQGQNNYIDKALKYGCGLRILKQDPWEMLVTFIISQRKNIPAISSCVEKIALQFGKSIKTDHETLYFFPEPQEMKDVSEDMLKKTGAWLPRALCG